MGTCCTCCKKKDPVGPPKIPTQEEIVNQAKTSRGKTQEIHSYMLGVGIFIGTVGSFGRMDYNIALFAFEFVRDKFFYNGWLGDKADYWNKGGYWYQPWNVITAGGKYQALYADLQRQIYFKWHSQGLLAWSLLVDVWWFFYVVWYMWASDEWKALAAWENVFHWITAVCGALCFLIKIAYFLMLFIEDIQQDCKDQGGCLGWCKAFWCCVLCTSTNPLDWPTPTPKAEPPKAVAPEVKKDGTAPITAVKTA